MSNTGAKVGYGRVSTTDQILDVQEKELRAAGCRKLFMEKESGARSDRPELLAAMEYLRDGDKLVITKLDRLSRSTRYMLEIVDDMEERNIGLIVLNFGGGILDTSSPAGKLFLTILAGMAEFERDMIRDRQQSGISHAKTTARHMGRPPLDRDTVETIKGLYAAGKSLADVARLAGVSLYAARKYKNYDPDYYVTKDTDGKLKRVGVDSEVAQ